MRPEHEGPLRVGVLGVGERGGAYARALATGAVRRARLVAVADIAPDALRPFPGIAQFDDETELLAGSALDALVIATPPA
ncbi:MAG TPA: Gfo/Idh/MocA family oxidoreductase, partial [Polyangiaceae bacterium]|nr:Gfo/Idh/MocA family oxidoreductase [Polyangiaceae bacterium]